MIPSKPSSWLKQSVAVAAFFAMVEPTVAESQLEPALSEQRPTVKELLRRLEARDALIADLQRRTKELERQVTEITAEGELSATTGPVSPIADPELSAEKSSVTEESAEDSPITEEDNAADEPPSENPPVAEKSTEEPPVAEGSAAPAAPGQFEVDEDAAERALERTLVVTGALLLPPGKAEIQPSFTYIQSEQDSPTFFAEGGLQFLATQDVRRDILVGDLTLRFGLPFDSQLELGVPYEYIDQQEVTRVGFAVSDETSNDGSGFGDFRLGLAKGLLAERHWWPNLIGRVTWNTGTGETRNGIQFGSGFKSLEGSLTMTKSQDPLVFIGSASYETAFEEDNFKPGDNFNFSVGTILAASPETSLRLILSQSFINDLELNGMAIEGTDQVVGTLNFGASSILGRGIFLDLNTGVGLTDAAADYSVGISLVVRFDVPGFF